SMWCIGVKIKRASLARLDSRVRLCLRCYVLATIDRNVVLRIGGSHIIRTRADEAVVVKLLDHVRSPTTDAGDCENRREHVHIDPKRVISGGGIEVDIRVQFLFLFYELFNTARLFKQFSLYA